MCMNTKYLDLYTSNVRLVFCKRICEQQLDRVTVRLHYLPVINNNREMPDEAACCEEENHVPNV